MTSDDAELANLAHDIDQVRDRLSLGRRLLADQLAPHAASADVVDVLLTACDADGVAHVQRALTDAPETYNLTALRPAQVTLVSAQLKQLSEAAEDFDRLVGVRETILLRQNPAHQRVFPWFGRTFVLDAAGKSLTFDGGDVEIGGVVPVPNRSRPDPSVIQPNDPRRRRRQTRDR